MPKTILTQCSRAITLVALTALAAVSRAEVHVTAEEIAAELAEAGLVAVEVRQNGRVQAGFPSTWSVDRVFDAMRPIEGEKTREMKEPMKEMANDLAKGAISIVVDPESDRVGYVMMWPPFLAVMLEVGMEDEFRYESEDEVFGPLQTLFGKQLSLPPNVVEHGVVNDYRGVLFNIVYSASDRKYDAGAVRRDVAFLLERVAPLFDTWSTQFLGERARMIPQSADAE